MRKRAGEVEGTLNPWPRPRSASTHIQWLHSYVTEDKVYCVYLAPDEDSIREHARKTGIPADRISAVRRLIDPANLK